MSEQKLIFLDVDGVLNSWDQIEESKRMRGMAPKHVAELARILRGTDAKIVVSSVWRFFGVGFDGSTPPNMRFGEELISHGADGELVRSRVIGRTGDLWFKAERREVRGFEIETWRNEHGHTGPFVIIDDDSDMGPLKPWLVQTSHQYGLTPEIADEVIRRLNGHDGVTP